MKGNDYTLLRAFLMLLVAGMAAEFTLAAGYPARPIRIVVEMGNSAGVFQLDQLFRDKLKGSGLEPYLEVEAKLAGETEKRLLKHFRL